MILDPKAANSLLPLITNLDAYEAFIKLLVILHNQSYADIRDCTTTEKIFNSQGKLQLIDELKELRERVRDGIQHLPTNSTPLEF